MGVYKMLVLNCQKMLEINCHFLLESTCRLQIPAITVSTTAFPMLLLASLGLFMPRLKLTNAQQPSPIITAMASAITVRGKTTVLAAFPYEPR